MAEHKIFEYKQEYKLESGKSLPEFQLFYTTYGTLNADKANVIWVCHAFSGSSDFTEWWPGIFGPGRLYPPEDYFIICANMLAGCYGSTGPLSINPETEQPYFHDFPVITNKDIAGAFDLLRQALGIRIIHTVIGCSMGGQQAIEWSVQQPEAFNYVISIGANAKHSPWGIAFNETQRLAIQTDATWKEKNELAGIEGMKTARAVALLSYRNYHTYEVSQQESADEKFDNFKAASYQAYQGEKLAKRFNAFTYWYISKAMDSHNIGRNRGGVINALKTITADCLFIGIDSDILFPVKEQKFMARHVTKGRFDHLDSLYGHDGFLIETEKVTEVINNFYKQAEVKPEYYEQF